ncbi:MAG: succinate dehydrogenase assembly factor 2 [Piscirickettsiaceae bacterium]|nr:MAG: succinate dehydrogenase assembly factor 2 [Piscirickettsiaceae bacterium]
MSEKSKLLWRCRRGVKELDIVFTRFVESSYDDLDEKQKSTFSALLEIEDPIILSYMLNQSSPDNKELASLVEKIRQSI